MHHTRPVFNLDSGRKTDAWKFHSATLLVLLVLSGICLQGYRMYSANSTDTGILYTPLETRFLGRNYKLRLLEQQMVDKDNEIRYLKYQIDKASKSAQLKDTNMEAAETLIKSLQDRGTSEREARTKAQLALAEKSSALTVCNSQREGLQTEVERCGNEVMALTHRRQAGTIIGSANGHLGGPIPTNMPRQRR
mmetsp:Transcript_5114/g.12557  ORF Transcript_5114/g.12557 Transcript_5114/m.12557 type:complete len:193 (-) Transcript_5114:108-686(-)